MLKENKEKRETNFNSNFNTNIEDYSIDELYNLIELEEFTREDILLKIHDLTSNTFKNSKHIKDFFSEVQNKLLNYLSNSDNNLEYDLHNNANNNIEINKNDTNEETNEDSNEETETNEETNTNNTNTNIKESYVDYSTYRETQTESGAIIEEYNIYKNLYFNTIYRSNSSSLLTTDCKITLTNPINNVIQCKLSSINIKKPFLIHTTKSNNTFIIKKYNKSNICDFSTSIIIENGYYEDKTDMETYLNKYFTSSNDNFMRAITFSINNNTKKSKFDLSNSYFIDNSNSFNYYEIDFKTNYTFPYSLATILGFDYNTNSFSNIPTEISSNHLQINSPKTYCTLNNPIYFCFNDYQNTTIETHQLFLNKNVSSDKILAKINTHKANIYSNYYIYEILDNIDNKNNVRQYSGNVNLSDFNIKIIDSYGNLVESIDEDFTFELEVIIHERKIKQITNNNKQTNKQTNK